MTYNQNVSLCPEYKSIVRAYKSTYGEIIVAISITDVLELYQTQYELVDSLWKYFATVSLAVLGFTVGSDRATHSRLEVTTIQIIYSIFSIGALIALLSLQEDLFKYKEWVRYLSSKLPPGSPPISVTPNTVGIVALYYICVFLGVLAVIEVTYRRRQRSAENRS